MAHRPRPSAQKLEKERARQEKQKDKEVRRMEAKKSRADTVSNPAGEDPDIAGIRPGPQPLPEQWSYVKTNR
jgi:hypothetical protein